MQGQPEHRGQQVSGQERIRVEHSLGSAMVVEHLPHELTRRAVFDHRDHPLELPLDGTSPLPDQAILTRLQVALDAARRIGARDTPAVIQTWFQGRNPTLDNQPPAQLLREANLDTVRDTIRDAATEFATHDT